LVLPLLIVILGLLIHLQPEKTDHTDLVDVKAENLGFYACSRFSRDNELDLVRVNSTTNNTLNMADQQNLYWNKGRSRILLNTASF
jgi:hypothetical protein